MDKTSLEYSTSIFGTYGSFNKTFGNLKSLEYLDMIISNQQDILDIKVLGKIHNIMAKINLTFKEILDVKNPATRKQISTFFRDHYLKLINETPQLLHVDPRIRSIMGNFVTVKHRTLIKN
jgi:hypothetical protein